MAGNVNFLGNGSNFGGVEVGDLLDVDGNSQIRFLLLNTLREVNIELISVSTNLNFGLERLITESGQLFIDCGFDKNRSKELTEQSVDTCLKDPDNRLGEEIPELLVFKMELKTSNFEVSLGYLSIETNGGRVSVRRKVDSGGEGQVGQSQSEIIFDLDQSEEGNTFVASEI